LCTDGGRSRQTPSIAQQGAVHHESHRHAHFSTARRCQCTTARSTCSPPRQPQRCTRAGLGTCIVRTRHGGNREFEVAGVVVDKPCAARRPLWWASTTALAW
jgi:hypothetical protein